MEGGTCGTSTSHSHFNSHSKDCGLWGFAPCSNRNFQQHSACGLVPEIDFCQALTLVSSSHHSSPYSTNRDGSVMQF
eukprot:6470409-Amphidinium_carterae.1